ncbi:uncharacterized protein LOC117321539 [Pecten maximus]|uniref:uncharacterized protein LOC117321539 n=1 Tax=Pecten maximus TaxID=6579 RepID=UPI001458C134|nr:uncharacterized protein LOC117321539 [Pecten maximus]
MSDEPKSIAKLSDLLDQVISQMDRVKCDLSHYEGEDYFGQELSSHSIKMELAKCSLETLILQAKKYQRQPIGRTAAGTVNSDSGIGSEVLEGRRDAMVFRDEDMPAPVHAERNRLGASIGNLPTLSESHCSVCLQQIKSPTQETEGQPRTPSEHDEQ